MIQIPVQQTANDVCALTQLARQFPWPDRRPAVQPINWGLDAGGKRLVTELIQQLPAGSVVLEIGSFIGGSALQWLACSDDFTLICVDPWKYDHSLRHFAERQGQPEWAIQQIDQAEGIHQTFLANLWNYRDRVIPIREYSHDALQWIANSGVSPELIYLDADKTGREIEPCYQLFPHAKLTGDDWWFGTDHWWRADDGYPIRRPVLEFCRQHDRFLRTEKMTWVIDTEPPSLSYRMKRPPLSFPFGTPAVSRPAPRCYRQKRIMATARMAPYVLVLARRHVDAGVGMAPWARSGPMVRIFALRALSGCDNRRLK